MKNKDGLGCWISTLAGSRFVYAEEVIFEGICAVKVDSTGDVPAIVLILEPTVNNSKTGYLRRVHSMN
jgi:hypothetical protein